MLGVLLYSTGPVFVAASAVSGAVFSFWRLWFGVAVLGIAAVIQGQVSGYPSARALRFPVLAGVLFGAHQLMFFTALKMTSVVDVTLVNTTSPVITGLLAIPVFAERPRRGFWGWASIAMIGSAVVVVSGSAGPRGDPLGMMLALGNVVAFAGFFLTSKSSRDHLAVLPFLAGVMFIAALFVSGYVLLAGEPVSSAGGRDLLFAVIVAAGPGAIGHFVMTWPLRWLPANVPPVMRLAIPVLASTWAWWLLGQPVSWWHLVGGAVTIAGVAGAILSPAGRELIVSESSEPPTTVTPPAGGPPDQAPRRRAPEERGGGSR